MTVVKTRSGALTSAELSRVHTRCGRLLRKMTSEPQISITLVMFSLAKHECYIDVWMKILTLEDTMLYYTFTEVGIDQLLQF